MNKKTVITIGSLIAGACLVVLMLTVASPALGEQAGPQAFPTTWPGEWQMGPSFDGASLGCTAGNGLARFTGIYNADDGLIYFLGGRCEDNSTVGTVFSFDPINQVYALEGPSMPTPVSNYTVAALDDGLGHGIGFYLVGGRTTSGGQTNAVQVFYPSDNTVATIATDNFPPTTLYSPGAVVSAANKLYVFGGFDGTNMVATTWVYDPAAAAGSRWSNSGCNLPTPRSYIASAVIGTKIYAIGGDEYTTGSLVPLDDTLVLDINNMVACWQDGAMADLPQKNGDTQAVYVDDAENFLDGGIYMVGGYFLSPGPYRWVFAYDVASDTWREDFPELTIPDPATGRRNHALVYVPSGSDKGEIGTGIPGIWAFGGFDGSAANAMTDTSEFYSYISGPVNVIPDQYEVLGVAGTTVNDDFIVQNNTGSEDSFTLAVTSDVTWTYTIPTSVGPVAPSGGEAPFVFSVDVPADAVPSATGAFTVTAISVSNPTISGTETISVRAIIGIGGTVLDATTGDPLVNAYVWAQTDPAGLAGEYYIGYTNALGQYVFADVVNGTYYMGASAQHFQASFYPDGWPVGAEMVTIADAAAVQNFNLVGSEMAWSPNELTYSFPVGSPNTGTLIITNTGTGPLYYSLNLLVKDQVEPPAAIAAIPELPRIDPQIAEDINASGSADFVVVLNGQADLTAAYSIKDWNARGEYVYNTLSEYADVSQTSLRRSLTASSVNYTPLYIINAVIVHGGDMNLVNSLAARADVAQIIANRKITVEEISWVDKLLASAPTVPAAVEWNIVKVNADDVWGMGYNGQGIVVAEVDSGTQWDHPALKSHYRGWNGSTADHNYNWYDPLGDFPDVPGAGSAHGTHVMGTMVGVEESGANQIGMAPGAKWISCKAGIVGTNYLGTNALLECAQWMIAPTDLQGNNPDPSLRPNVVNNSWGGGPNDYWYSGAVDAWRAAGIFPSFATGNAGPSCSSAHSPGDYWNSFGTGATDNTDTIASFSGRGPALYTGVLKPQIVAPGVNIRSSVPGGGYQQSGWNGTSMATPHTSGAVALLWSAAPELIGQIDLTSWLLDQTAKPFTTNEGCGGDSSTDIPNNTYGWGRLDVQAAVANALTIDFPSWLSVDPLGGTVNPGESADVTLTFNPIDVGIYTATLWLVADDPYNPDVRLPIKLTAIGVPPTPEFESNSPVFLGETAAFTPTVTGTGPFVYEWAFGDGGTSAITNTTHVYTATGVYNVSLDVTSDYGEDLVAQDFEVVGIPPTGTFTSPAPITLGELVTFTVDVSGTSPFEYEWDFGDGVTSTLESPTHMYEWADTFTVTVTVISDWGSFTLFDQFVVNAPVEAYKYIYLPLVGKGP